MLIFENYTEEMFKEDNKKNKISKKHYRLFINDLVKNLPKALNLEKLEPKREVLKINMVLSMVLDNHLGHNAFAGLELNSLFLILGYSHSLEEVETKILDRLPKEYSLYNLREVMCFDEFNNEYLEKYQSLVKIVELLKKKKSVTSYYLYRNNKDYSIYARSPRKGNLSYHHLIYNLIDQFIYQNENPNHHITYDIYKVVADDGTIIFDGEF